MTLTLTLAQFGAPRAGVRALAICALAALALALALGCGGGGGDAPILDKSDSAVVMDVSAILGASEIPTRLNDLGFSLPGDSSLEDPDEWKSELRDDLESDGFAPADSISALANVGGSAAYVYAVGGLDFADLRSEMEDDGLEEGGYRGFELWESSYSYSTAAILEDRELVVSGNSEYVKEVIKAFDRGDGFADETDPLKRVLDKAGDGLVVRALTRCNAAAIFPDSSSSCIAVAESVTGGDAEKTEMSVVYLFRSERSAESVRNDLVDDGYSGPLDVDLTDINADGEFVTYRATIYE